MKKILTLALLGLILPTFCLAQDSDEESAPKPRSQAGQQVHAARQAASRVTAHNKAVDEEAADVEDDSGDSDSGDSEDDSGED